MAAGGVAMRRVLSRAAALARFRALPIFIYALYDPRERQPRYIGRSVEPGARLKQHAAARGFGKARVEWLRRLKADGHSPDVLILERALGVVEAIRAEQWWLDFGRRAQWPLLNRPGSSRGGVWPLGLRDRLTPWGPFDFRAEFERTQI